MTPDKRLNQIEPELAEVIQKVDRLIESNGKIVELAVDTRAELEETKGVVAGLVENVSRLDKTVVGLVENVGRLDGTVVGLVENVGRLDETVVYLGQKVAGLSETVVNLGEKFVGLTGTVVRLDQTVINLSETVDSVKANGESTARAVANLTVTNQKQFDDLKAGQELILQILREKLP